MKESMGQRFWSFIKKNWLRMLFRLAICLPIFFIITSSRLFKITPLNQMRFMVTILVPLGLGSLFLDGMYYMLGAAYLFWGISPILEFLKDQSKPVQFWPMIIGIPLAIPPLITFWNNHFAPNHPTRVR